MDTRMALGAQRNQVVGFIVRQGLILAAAGVLLGMAAALAVTRFVESLLFAVESTDPTTFAAVAGLLLLVTLIASWIPARRASRVDPMVALRYD